MNVHSIRGERKSRWPQFLILSITVVMIVAVGSHTAAAWFGLQPSKPTYRRIGPEAGPQAFLAGSSLLQFGLAWPEVSETLGQGIECWAIGGSSPEVWEVFQHRQTNSNLLIIGFSAYDLNEKHLNDHRAENVSLVDTVRNLARLNVDFDFSRRVLGQYPLAVVRLFFPTAGQSGAVLTGTRRKVLQLSGSGPTEEKANAMVLPKTNALDFGDSEERLSDWPEDKYLRRFSLIRTEIEGEHRFDQLQRAALLRMLEYAQQRGRIIVVVMPVAPSYARELLNSESLQRFEHVLTEAKMVAPQAEFVRLDLLPSLQSDELYSDFIHLNGAGKRIATDAFLKQVHEDFLQP